MKILIIKDIEIRGVVKRAGLIMEGTDDWCYSLIVDKKARGLTQEEEIQIKTSKAKEHFMNQKMQEMKKIEEAKEKKKIEIIAEEELEKEIKKPKKK